MEVTMGIAACWQPTVAEYKDTLRYLTMRKYCCALDNLQRLVVMRLFELHKLNLSQTGKLFCLFIILIYSSLIGYRVRTHIAKSLQTRCQAIRNAVKTYNTAAAALSPPRPSLNWSDVSHYSFLDEFELLRDTRGDIRSRPWAQPAVREAMKQYQRIARAKEEIYRCNIEIRRLYTSILDEHRTFSIVIARLNEDSCPILGAVKEFVLCRRRVNNTLLVRISQIFELKGYTGETTAGVRKGSIPVDSHIGSIFESEKSVVDEEEAEGVEPDEEDEEQLAGLVDYISNLAVHSVSSSS